MKQHHLDYLLGCLQENKNDSILLEKIYQAQTDGDRNYHYFCDYKGETVTVILSRRTDMIFGAYTSHNIDSNENFKQDNKSFLFSLTKEKKYPIKKSSYATYNTNKVFNIGFGYPDGILLKENFLSVVDNFAEVWGDCYHSKYPGKRILLAGEENFQVEEVEVFKVIRN